MNTEAWKQYSSDQLDALVRLFEGQGWRIDQTTCYGNVGWYAYTPNREGQVSLVAYPYRWDTFYPAAPENVNGRSPSVEVEFYIDAPIEGATAKVLVYGLDSVEYDAKRLEEIQSLANAVSASIGTWKSNRSNT